jgi:hypothetical protein
LPKHQAVILALTVVQWLDILRLQAESASAEVSLVIISCLKDLPLGGFFLNVLLMVPNPWDDSQIDLPPNHVPHVKLEV